MIPSIKKFIKFASKKHPDWDFSINEEHTGFTHMLVEMAYQGYLIGRESFGFENASVYCLATATEEGLVFSDKPVFTANLDQVRVQSTRMHRKTGRHMVTVSIHVKDVEKIQEEMGYKPFKFLVKSNAEMKEKPKKIQRRWTFFEPDARRTLNDKIVKFAKNEMTTEIVDKFWQNVTQGEINFKNAPEIRYQFADTKDMLAMYMEKDSYASTGEVVTLNVTYLEYAGLNTEYCAKGEKPKPMYYTKQTQYFHVGKLKEAIECFIGRIQSEHPMRVFGESQKLEAIRVSHSGILQRESHYDYLDEMLNPFWTQVFGKSASDMFCGGIVGAHGDKAYGYRNQWDEQGISFQHGALLFLLTYTKEMGETPKHHSCEWVIENYPRYFRKIIEAEKIVLKENYGVEPRQTFEIKAEENNTFKLEVYENKLLTQSYTGNSEDEVTRLYLEDSKLHRILQAKQATLARSGRL